MEKGRMAVLTIVVTAILQMVMPGMILIFRELEDTSIVRILQ